MDADSRGVDKRLFLEPGQAIFDIAELELAKIPIHGPHRFGALPARRPVVADPHDDAQLREKLVIHALGAAPCIPHLLRVRARVGELIDRIAARRIEVRRLDQHRFHDEPVARRHLHEFRLRELVLPERGDLVLVDRPHLCAIVAVQTHLRWRVHVAPRVHVVGECRAETSGVRSRRCRQPFESAAVQPHAVRRRRRYGSVQCPKSRSTPWSGRCRASVRISHLPLVICLMRVPSAL